MLEILEEEDPTKALEILAISSLMLDYKLAQNITDEGYVDIIAKINLFQNLTKSIAIYSIIGDKKSYERVKKLFQEQFKNFLKVHETILKKQIENKHSTH